MIKCDWRRCVERLGRKKKKRNQVNVGRVAEAPKLSNEAISAMVERLSAYLGGRFQSEVDFGWGSQLPRTALCRSSRRSSK